MMNAMNKCMSNQASPALKEVQTSELQTIVGGRVEIYRELSYPPGGFPTPTPWRAAGYPVPDPWLVAAQQQNVIGT
jgi:hypothetical protein